MEIDLKIAGDEDAILWDKIIDSSPYSTIFHTWKWLKITEKHTKSKLYPVIGLKGSTTIGIYPLFYQKKFGMKCVFSPPPAAAIPFLGPIIVNYDTLKQNKKEAIFVNFQRRVDEFIFSELKSNYVMVSLVPNMDPRSFVWTKYTLRALFDYYVDLSKGVEKVWQDFDKSARDHIKKVENIKKTEHDVIDVTDGSKDELCYLYDLMVKRYREQKRPVMESQKYLLDIYDAFYPQNLKLFAVKHKGHFIGGIVAILYKDKISFWIGGAKPEIKNLSATEVNHWEAIKWACNNGFNVYEEFGANSERLCMSKSKYNPSLCVRFIATKHSSFIYALAEKIYSDVIKKVYGVLLSLKK